MEEKNNKWESAPMWALMANHFRIPQRAGLEEYSDRVDKGQMELLRLMAKIMPHTVFNANVDVIEALYYKVAQCKPNETDVLQQIEKQKLELASRLAARKQLRDESTGGPAADQELAAGALVEYLVDLVNTTTPENTK